MPKQRPNQPEGAMKRYAIGKTAQMVKRVKHNGIVSSDANENAFIKVGKTLLWPPLHCTKSLGKDFALQLSVLTS